MIIMKLYSLIFKSVLLIIIVAGTFLYSCNIDNMEHDLEDKDLYIKKVIIEAANNSFLSEDIIASVTNYSRSIVATLPAAAEGHQVVLTFDLPEQVNCNLSPGQAIDTDSTFLTISGFGFEEVYSVYLKVMEPFDSSIEFVSLWEVADNEQITLPLIETGNYNFMVFWGDGDSSIVATYDLVSASHTYASAGQYTVTIWGNIEGINFYVTNASAKNIIDILDWGQLKLGNDGFYFRGCSNLQISATNAPDLSETDNLRCMFREATSFNSPINHWDVSGVTSMWDMFYKATNFNQPLDQWDVSSVETFETMFQESAFNQDISGWNISSAKILKNMFRSTPFNQPIGNWNISNVENFQSMFRANKVFNQDLSGWGDKFLGLNINCREMFRETEYNGDLSAWDVSNITVMWDMFKASKFDNPSINNWNVSNVQSMETMFGDSQFNQDISGWNTQNVTTMKNLMQRNTAFNQNLSGWNTSKVTCNTNFDQGATSWENANKPVFATSGYFCE